MHLSSTHNHWASWQAPLPGGRPGQPEDRGCRGQATDTLYLLIHSFKCLFLLYVTILCRFCHTLTWTHHGCICVPKQARMKRSHFVMGTLKIVRQTIIIKITWAVAMQLINSQYFELLGNELTCPADWVCSRARNQDKPYLHPKPTISIPSCIFSVNQGRIWMSVGYWSWSVMQHLDQYSPKEEGKVTHESLLDEVDLTQKPLCRDVLI